MAHFPLVETNSGPEEIQDPTEKLRSRKEIQSPMPAFLSFPLEDIVILKLAP